MVKHSGNLLTLYILDQFKINNDTVYTHALGVFLYGGTVASAYCWTDVVEAVHHVDERLAVGYIPLYWRPWAVQFGTTLLVNVWEGLILGTLIRLLHVVPVPGCVSLLVEKATCWKRSRTSTSADTPLPQPSPCRSVPVYLSLSICNAQ